MKFKPFFLLLASLLPAQLSAQWLPVGQADYNWGPFLVYRLALFTETGNYQQDQRPLMLTFVYDKQVEGKNFAVSLIKEMENAKLDEQQRNLWLKELQRIFPDFSPNDKLSYIALVDKGYFVLNDTVLDAEFDPFFSQILINIWLSPQSNFSQIRDSLLDKSKSQANPQPSEKTPESVPLNEENINPQLPPTYPLDNRPEGIS